jgi:hypothetical protein
VSKWQLLSFNSNQGNRKVGWVGDDSHVVFGQKLSAEKGKSETVHCRDTTASSFIAKLRGKVFTHFHAVTIKCHNSMWN